MTPLQTPAVRDTLVRKLGVNLLFIELGFIVTLYSPLAPSAYWQSRLSAFGIVVAALAIGAGVAWLLWGMYRDEKEIQSEPS